MGSGTGGFPGDLRTVFGRVLLVRRNRVGPWHDPLSSQSPESWGWDEWGDLVVYRPVGYEPGYHYPLVIWLSQDEVLGITLHDWFPDLSERNYIGAEVRLFPGSTILQSADRVAVAIREVVALYGIHRQRVWIAGVGEAADAVLRMLPALTRLVSGGIAIAPGELEPMELDSTPGESDQSLYLATGVGDESQVAESLAEHWEESGGQCSHTEWESISASRLALCRDINAWLMEQVCAPAELDSRG
jgi:hypothetical protein